MVAFLMIQSREKMKNRIVDLNNHLFAQLERLGDESTDTETLKLEIGRAKAISTVAKDIIAAQALVLESAKYQNDFRHALMPDLLAISGIKSQYE